MIYSTTVNPDNYRVVTEITCHLFEKFNSHTQNRCPVLSQVSIAIYDILRSGLEKSQYIKIR